jgi:hypothetical protein
MLAMDVHQPVADFAQLVERGGMPVDECSGAAAPVDHATQQQPARIALQRLLT